MCAVGGARRQPRRTDFVFPGSLAMLLWANVHESKRRSKSRIETLVYSGRACRHSVYLRELLVGWLEPTISTCRHFKLLQLKHQRRGCSNSNSNGYANCKDRRTCRLFVSLLKSTRESVSILLFQAVICIFTSCLDIRNWKYSLRPESRDPAPRSNFGSKRR